MDRGLGEANQVVKLRDTNFIHLQIIMSQCLKSGLPQSIRF